MKILITGGCGQTGSHWFTITTELNTNGYTRQTVLVTGANPETNEASKTLYPAQSGPA
jgi:hypothetical protein